MDKLSLEYLSQLKKTISHLEYSYKKVQGLSYEVETLSEEELESWEGFSSRFSRTAEIFLSRFLRARIKFQDPGFSGSFRDLLNKSIQMGLIEDVDFWLKIREFRNREAHEYNEKSLGFFFKELRLHAPKLIALKDKF